jgi:hypothetical protein
MSSIRFFSAVAVIVAAMSLNLRAQEAAAPGDAAKVTEAVNVVVHKPDTGDERPAKINDQIKGDEVLRTGERSMAEVEFKDRTVTRLGSKSVFTFDGQPRKYNVRKGLAVICVPKGTGEEKGKKKGEISSSSLTAAIEGTTVLVQEIELPPLTPGGEVRRASRMIFLEGDGTVTSKDGTKKRKVKAGQMMVKFEDDPDLPVPVDIDMAALVQGSPLAQSLPSSPLIQEVIQQQQIEIVQGTLTQGGGTPGPDTSPPVDPVFQNGTAGNGVQGLDCEFVGNGFYLCYQPCPECTVCTALDDGGYVCRHD